MDGSLLDMMTFQCSWKNPSGADGYGKRTYPAAATDVSKCYWHEGHRTVRNAAGETVTEKATLYLPAAPDIDPEAQVTLPSGDVAGPLISVQRFYDEYGSAWVTVLTFG